MPLPGVTWPVRHEVGSSLVLHPLRESQQHPYVIVCGLWAVGSAVRQTHTCSGTKWLRKQTISARLFLISAQLRTKRSAKRLWRLKLNCEIIYWTNQSHRTPTFPTQPKQKKQKNLIIERVVQSGEVQSQVHHAFEDVSHLSCDRCWQWSVQQITRAHLLVIAPNADRKWNGFEEWLVLALGKEQIEQTTLLHHINSVPSAVGLGAPGQGAQQELYANTDRWN